MGFGEEMEQKRKGWKLDVWRGHMASVLTKRAQKTEQVVTDCCCDIQGGTGKEKRTCIALDRSIKQSYDYFM